MKRHSEILNDLKDCAEPHAKLVYVSKSNITKTKAKEIISLIDELLNSASCSTEEKGNRLEKLVDNLLKTTGVFVNVDRLKDDKGDFDHIFTLNKDYWDLVDTELVEKYGTKGAGESKNHKDHKINVTITYKLEALKHLNDIKIGCYFTRLGSTGDDGSHAAKAVMRGYKQKFSLISIVFKDEDWLFIKKNPHYFSSLFYEKLRLVMHDKDSESIDYSKVLSFAKINLSN
jgi:hypothetical protein